MLGDANAYATIAVKDLAAAKQFYADTLGLVAEEGGEDPGGVFYKTGSTKVFVYQSSYAGTNQATTATWGVPNTDEVVKALAAKGITFEHYDSIPGVTLEGDVHVMGELRAAWFKDPDGNILNVVNHAD